MNEWEAPGIENCRLKQYLSIANGERCKAQTPFRFTSRLPQRIVLNEVSLHRTASERSDRYYPCQDRSHPI